MSFREDTSFGRVTFKYPPKLPVYTTTTVPAATLASSKNAIVIISNGGTGSTPILAFSNGTNWVAFGAVSTTVIV